MLPQNSQILSTPSIVYSALFQYPQNQNPTYHSSPIHTQTQHTVTMEEPKNNPVHVEEEKEEKNPVILFFTSVLSAIKLPFPPPKKNGVKVEPVSASSSSSQADEPIKIKPAAVEIGSEKSVTVTYPKQTFAPLKLEAESEEADRSTNPVFLWQVYAVGGFVVLRWAWKRWNERKGQKKPDDDEPPPARD